jgi:hypothetical protein
VGLGIFTKLRFLLRLRFRRLQMKTIICESFHNCVSVVSICFLLCSLYKLLQLSSSNGSSFLSLVASHNFFRLFFCVLFCHCPVLVTFSFPVRPGHSSLVIFVAFRANVTPFTSRKYYRLFLKHLFEKRVSKMCFQNHS